MYTEGIKMQINVKNVAKILDAEVVLDGVSVIAGYNNMGKSTILKAAYIVLNTFRNLNHKVSIVRKQSIESYFTQLESYFDNSGYVRFPRELLYTIADHVNDYIGVFMNSEKDNYDLFHMIISDSFEEYKEF